MKTLEEIELEYKTEKINKAIGLLLYFNNVDGIQHKNWLIDQVLRTLAGTDIYNHIIKELDYKWEKGIAP